MCEVATRVEYYRLGARLRERGLEEAISKAATVAIESGAELRAATPPLLVATKLCAWKGRGNRDLLGSLDVHDILTLFDGRPELATEIEASEPRLRQYLQAELAELKAEPYFDYAVDGATAPYGSLGGQRASLVRERIDGLLL